MACSSSRSVLLRQQGVEEGHKAQDCSTGPAIPSSCGGQVAAAAAEPHLGLQAAGFSPDLLHGQAVPPGCQLLGGRGSRRKFQDGGWCTRGGSTPLVEPGNNVKPPSLAHTHLHWSPSAARLPLSPAGARPGLLLCARPAPGVFGGCHSLDWNTRPEGRCKRSRDDACTLAALQTCNSHMQQHMSIT